MNNKRIDSSRTQTSASEKNVKENLEKQKKKLLQNMKAKKEKVDDESKNRIQVIKQTQQKKPLKVLKNVDQNKAKKDSEEQRLSKLLIAKSGRPEIKVGQSAHSIASDQQIHAESEHAHAGHPESDGNNANQDLGEVRAIHAQPFEQALGATKRGSTDVECKPSHRKISNEIDFDSQLCYRVDMLLNQNDKGRTKRNENLPQKYEISQAVDAQ